ncbi:hypothetical protein DRP04_13260 [Archaeoglobales archaeon]|nr:MAG: hypothetical protein DRP04_13260 [Archaeoglobales archaeon]
MGAPSTDVVIPPKTATIKIDKLDYESERYSELSEEDLKKLPALKKALKEMSEKRKKSILYEVSREGAGCL